jgi:hypothetical protein
MKKLILLLLITTLGFAQAPTKNANGFFAGTGTMNASAIGQFDSTSKGFLFPRMTTTQRNAIASPATSLVIFNTTTGAYNYWNGTAWTTFGGGGVPTLQQVLDNNHDLVDGNNFQGSDAGVGNEGAYVNGFGIEAASYNSGNNINALGAQAAFENISSDVNALGDGAASVNSGDNVNAFGFRAASYNSGTDVNAFGDYAASDNTAPHVNAFGFFAGYEFSIANVFKNVNLFGFFASADADNQNVFSKWVTGTTKYLGRLSFNNITADRKWELPNASGTIALTSDITSATSLQAVTTNGKTTNKGITLTVPTTYDDNSYFKINLGSQIIPGFTAGHRETAGDRTGFITFRNIEDYEELNIDNDKVNILTETKNINYLFDKTKASGTYTLATTSDIPAGITVDATPTDGSSNAVSSNGVFDALVTKVSKSDYTPSHSILVQQSGTGSPTALQVVNNTLVGRVSGGGSDIDDLSTSQVRTMLSINNVDNTSDANKPVSTATQTALNLKVNKNRFIYQPKVSVTGIIGETNICSFKIDGGAYESTDAFKLDFIMLKSTTAASSTFKVYVGTTSGSRTNQIMQVAIIGANRTGDVTRLYNIDAGSLDTSVIFTANAQSGLSGINALNTPISVNMANDLWITITANPSVTSESHGVLMASVTPLK